jgi:mannitol/fructose-specific phosphotransferase system IIA component (Ntr-type)
MPFVSRLRPDQIVVNPPWHTFAQTIDGLLDVVARIGLVPPGTKAAAAAAIAAREAEASTAVLETGVGVPHARLPGLEDPVVALAVAQAGLYQAAPTVPIRIVALVVSPAQSIEEHLRTLAEIATLLHSADLRARLLRASDAPAAFATLRQFSGGVG